MAAAEVTISGVLYDKLNRTTQQVVLIGEATITGLNIGGGPMPPGSQPPWWPGHPEHPIPPVVGGGPIYPPTPPWWPGHPEHPIPPVVGGGPILPDPPPEFPDPPDGMVKDPPPEGGWGYNTQYGWGYFPGTSLVPGPKGHSGKARK
jgi:hypothetical protein